jgi:hypothetical protein
MKLRYCQIALLCLCVVAYPLVAQEILDPALEPEGGTAEVAPGFTPDPLRIPLTSGGDIDVNSRGLGQDCVGFVTGPPDFRLTAQGEFPLLRFIFIADTLTTDTSLIVRTPDGRFLCNNNAFGIFNPMVDAVDAMEGSYVVWVGGFGITTLVHGDLYITTNSAIIPGSTGIVIPIVPATSTPTLFIEPTLPSGSNLSLNPALPAAQGSISLEAGFLPDPFWTVIAGGGALPVPAFDENVIEGSDGSLPECTGFTDIAPDFRLQWSERSTRLRFHFVPLAIGDIEPDAALIVQSPDGEWACNRDFASGYTRPSVEFINPSVGTYHIWVANEVNVNTEIIGVLYITEIATSPETVRQIITPPVVDLVGLDAGQTNTITDLTLATSDPFSISNVVSAGTIDIVSLNPALPQPNHAQVCAGFYEVSPTEVLNLEQSLPYLRAFFIADTPDANPTLIIRMPDGQWYCGNDSFDTLNPTVHVIGNSSSGILRVWLGSSGSGDFVSGTLYFTRGSASPVPGGAIGLPTPTLASPALSPVNLPTSVPMPTLPIAENPAGLDPFAAPNYGMVSLGAAVIPLTLEASGGGTLDVSALGEECVGFVTAQPDYRVQWSGTGEFLRFYFLGLGDTILVVYSPDGVWHCNDDSFVSVNPTVDILNPVPGTYNVWIGSFDPGLTIRGTLYITEDTNRMPGN